MKKKIERPENNSMTVKRKNNSAEEEGMIQLQTSCPLYTIYSIFNSAHGFSSTL